MATHSSILAWRIPHGQRSLAFYGPQGCKELDMTEANQHTHVHLSGISPAGWGAPYGAQTPHSSGRASVVVKSLSFVGCHTGDVDSEQTAPPNCLKWPFIYILCCRKSVLLAFRENCSRWSCTFGVYVGEGKLRIFLLCYLDVELCFSSVLFLCVLHIG